MRGTPASMSRRWAWPCSMSRPRAIQGSVSPACFRTWYAMPHSPPCQSSRCSGWPLPGRLSKSPRASASRICWSIGLSQRGCLGRVIAGSELTPSDGGLALYGFAQDVHEPRYLLWRADQRRSYHDGVVQSTCEHAIGDALGDDTTGQADGIVVIR